MRHSYDHLEKREREKNNGFTALNFCRSRSRRLLGLTSHFSSFLANIYVDEGCTRDVRKGFNNQGILGRNMRPVGAAAAGLTRRPCWGAAASCGWPIAAAANCCCCCWAAKTWFRLLTCWAADAAPRSCCGCCPRPSDVGAAGMVIMPCWCGCCGCCVAVCRKVDRSGVVVAAAAGCCC